MSLKFASPLLGYNNNVRYKGRVFHIQTEDSGAKYGHVITHLFMDGGRILKSVKTSYADDVGSDRRPEIVRDLMKQQHRAMAIALRDGTFDRLVEGGSSGSQDSPSTANAEDPTLVALPSATLGPLPSMSTDANNMTLPPSLSSGPSANGHTGPQGLDIALFERAAAVASAKSPPDGERRPPALRSSSDRDTPKPAGAEAAGFAHPSTTRPVSAAATGGPPTHAARAAATTRPASAFGQARPQGQSIFGEDLMSDKSLDEVILTYLAAELETEKK